MKIIKQLAVSTQHLARSAFRLDLTTSWRGYRRGHGRLVNDPLTMLTMQLALGPKSERADCWEGEQKSNQSSDSRLFVCIRGQKVL